MIEGSHGGSMEGTLTPVTVVQIYGRFGETQGKGHPRTGHEIAEGEYGYSSTISLFSTLDGGGWSTPRPVQLTPGKEPVPILQ
jgi:hypothetical protein